MGVESAAKAPFDAVQRLKALVIFQLRAALPLRSGSPLRRKNFSKLVCLDWLGVFQ